MAQRDSNQSGQSIVIMAFAVVVLMGIMALAIDGGRIYTLRRDAQNAADAAALQGAKSLCQDEDFEAKALEVAAMNGFFGPGVVEVNNPPIHSDAPTVNADQVEVVITGTIQGGMIAPVVYQGELNTRVQAVGDCIRGSLSGSGVAIFAKGDCPGPYEASVTGSNVSIVGGIHSNGGVQVSGNSSNPATITGTITYVDTDDEHIQNATLFPVTGNPAQTTPKDYPLELAYADFVPAAEPNSNGANGWAYDAVMGAYPDGSRYHYHTGEITKDWLTSSGKLVGNILAKGVYVSPVGFQLNSMGDFVGDDVTFVSLGKITVNGGNSTFRPYFGGLLVMTEGGSGLCDNSEIVSLTGSNINWGGIVFAPNGSIKLSNSGGGSFYGSLIGGQVSLSGSNLLVIYDPSFLPPDPDTIELGE